MTISDISAIKDRCAFDEDQWLKLLFLLSDTQEWLTAMHHDLVLQLPLDGKKKLWRQSFSLPVTAIAHIIERHYHKIARYPNAGKFTIPVVDILSLIRDAFGSEAKPIPGSLNMHRVTEARQVVGFDDHGKFTQVYTVIANAGGQVITAFPGTIRPPRTNYPAHH